MNVGGAGNIVRRTFRVSKVNWRKMMRDYPFWWPENPYPEEIFPMTEEDYVKYVPDAEERTAMSGCLGRLFWDIASKSILDAYLSHEPPIEQTELEKACEEEIIWLNEHEVGPK